MAPSIVFDFDGTLAIGHGPVRAYAQQVAMVAEHGAASDADEFLAEVDAALASYDAGQRDYRDGYDVVGSLAAARRVSAEALQRAYHASRDMLGTDAAPVDTMVGLPDFLTTLGRSARLILATNAPETGIDRVLRGWGVAGLFDELHFAVGKPEGLTRLIAPLIAQGPVLAIGDIAAFDLAPAHALGADTAFIGATAGAAAEPADFPVTLRASSLAALRTEIETWAATAASSIPGHSATAIER